MKRLIALIYLIILSSCSNPNLDKVFCQGACPNNQICLLGECQCEVGKTLVNGYCYEKVKKDSLKSVYGNYFPIDSSTCFIPNTFFNFVPPSIISYKDTLNTQVTFADSDFNINLIGTSPSPFGLPCQYTKGNDSLIRFSTILYDINYGPCANCQPTTNNSLKLLGRFNQRMDTVIMAYYFSCCNGQIKDTCYKTFVIF